MTSLTISWKIIKIGKFVGSSKWEHACMVINVTSTILIVRKLRIGLLIKTKDMTVQHRSHYMKEIKRVELLVMKIASFVWSLSLQMEKGSVYFKIALMPSV